MEIEHVDRISQLPEFILHDILSLLPAKDAARTSVLSKQWSRIWESYPILAFEQDRCPVYRLLGTHDWLELFQQVHTLLRCAKNRLIKFSNSKLTGQRFKLFAWNCDIESSYEVVECFDLALLIGIPDIEIDLSDPNYLTRIWLDSVVPGTVLVPIPFEYHSLTKLSLSGVCLSEDWIRFAVQNCPNIFRLSLHHISGLQRLRISKLDNLTVVSIRKNTDLVSVDIIAPKLQEFEFSDECVPCDIDLSSCRDMRKLKLDSLRIEDEAFRSLISKFPLLEDLTLSSNVALRTVTVSGTNLRRVDISVVDEIEAVEIDAPAMLSYRFEGQKLPRTVFKRVPSRMEIVYVLGGRRQADTFRFLHLREFLASFSQPKALSVDVKSVPATFYREELKRTVVPPSSQLDHLKLTFTRMTACFDMSSLIEGLLWSTHPKRLSLILASPSCNSHIKFLCKRLLENGKRCRTCCGSSRIKCWRHYLKSARIEGLEGDVDSAVFLEDKLMSNVICFKIEWDDSIH